MLDLFLDILVVLLFKWHAFVALNLTFQFDFNAISVFVKALNMK